MKRLIVILASIAVPFSLSLPVFAQDSSKQVLGTVQQGNTTIEFQRSNAGLNLDQLNAFAQVSSSDPALASKLARNPALVNDAAFVSKHPALQQYLEKYPDARTDIVANPGNYLTPVNGSSWTHAPAGMKE